MICPCPLQPASRFQRWFNLPFLAILVFVCSVATQGQARKTFRAARLTYLEGEVHVSQANSSAKDTAILNMPLIEGSVISTGEDGQAEIEFEDGSLVRVTPNSGASLVNLSIDASGNYQTRVALTGGLSYLELRAGTKYQYSIDAGGDVISPIENATIRVDLDQPPAAIAVLDGSAHIAATTGSASVDANAGQTVTMTGPAEGGTYLIKAEIASESWDQWNEERDSIAASETGSQTDARSKFAGDQGYGWSDLDANGSWYDVPGQGEVWQPNDAEQSADEGFDAGQGGFDPYANGGWAWTPAGYTWASAYGWGWLPYRCGQWSYWDGFGWGWTPGIACGSFGFGGFGYGVISIGRAPGFYHRPHRPIPGPGPIHPIQRGPGGPVPIDVARNGGTGSSFARRINGHTVEPLQPVSGGYTPRGGSTLGWGLRRDFPVNTKTQEPVIGVVAANPSPVILSNGRLSPPSSFGATRSRTAPTAPVSGYVTQRPYQRPYQGATAAPSYRPSPMQQPASRPAPTYAPRYAPSPAPRSAPAPAPASHSAPAASPHGK